MLCENIFMHTAGLTPFHHSTFHTQVAAFVANAQVMRILCGLRLNDAFGFQMRTGDITKQDVVM